MVANLGCSQRYGKHKEEWTAWGDLDADVWIKILMILQNNCHQPFRPTQCHQWLGRRFKRGAFDIGRNIKEQFSVSLPH